MKPAGFSVARLMGAIAIASLGCAAYRVELADPSVYRLYHELVIGVVPMACLLVFGLAVAGSDVARRGACRPFWLGFELAGWVALFAVASFMAVNFENGRRAIGRLYPLTSWFVGSPNMTYTDLPVVAFHSALFFVPEFALASLGGWATTSLKVTVARQQAAVGQ